MSPLPDQSTDTILLDVAQQFGAAPDLEQLLQTVVERVTSVERAERAMFALCEPDGRVTRAVCHNLAWAGPGHPLPISSTVFDEAVRTRRPVLVLDALSDAVLGKRDSVRQFGLRRIIAVPIEGQGRVCAVLYADSPLAADDSADEALARMAAIGRLVATALENARLVERLRAQEASSGREHRLERATAAWKITDRQREVLAQLVEGRSNKEIANDLGIAEATVEIHVTGLLRRAGCDSRTTLMARFWQLA